ncbi:homoserine O-acetyltransferase [Saccharomyces cerevisiae]|nr:homoserine O-acetyltransferase [Saccharomyces cerevisiae]
MSHTLKSKTLQELDIEEIKETNPLLKLVQGQRIVQVPELVLESGVVINNFPIAYKTWGTLNEAGDNVLVICHALTGSADVADWWGPLLGNDLAFDPSRFFIICLNSMGSPYGSFSPLTINEETGNCSGFSGSKVNSLCYWWLYGGMLSLEWAAMYGKEYVKNMVALATSARHSAWCISWSEAQRQSIYSDPNYLDGYYPVEEQPVAGLSAARMSALLTYRTRNSFENKFSRRSPSIAQQQKAQREETRKPSTVSEHSLQIHNDGYKTKASTAIAGISGQKRQSVVSTASSSDSLNSSTSMTSVSSVTGEVKDIKPAQTYFSAQSYLRYQGTKFINRFDANCYIAITRKLDTHDLARDRVDDITEVLSTIQQPSLIIGIQSDGLFTYSEQEFLAEHIPKSQLEKIESPEGHDAFLLEFKLINKLIVQFLKTNCKAITDAAPRAWGGDVGNDETKTSVFGEAEEVTNW